MIPESGSGKNKNREGVGFCTLTTIFLRRSKNNQATKKPTTEKETKKTKKRRRRTAKNGTTCQAFPG